MEKIFDLEAYAAKSREAMAEGIVLLQNDNQALPLARGSKVALFGRSQFHYYKSGTGSGGMVNTAYVTGVREAIEQTSAYELNEEVKEAYDVWIREHPYNTGNGWADEPWFQEEMPVAPELARRAAAQSEAAIVLIGRTAGEDQDNQAEEGSYYLTSAEKEMLQNVTEAFDRTIVLLNTGNIIDMNWVEEYDPEAVLYIWQGGQEGGNGVLDVLDGTVSPSGRLADTIAYNLEDYPAWNNYGGKDHNLYAEDIYVGYRYFETFAPEKVQFPFGYGLSYTDFEMEICGTPADKADDFKLEKETILKLSVKVTNIGAFPGKEVVQAYVSAPQGKLGKAAVSLIGYAKTKVLQPQESQMVTISFTPYTFASYDDTGVTGYKSCYLLEAGTYQFFAGNNCRELLPAFALDLARTEVLEQLTEAMGPEGYFKRLKPIEKKESKDTIPQKEMVEADEKSTSSAAEMDEKNTSLSAKAEERKVSCPTEGEETWQNPRYEKSFVVCPPRKSNRTDRRRKAIPEDIPYSGDRGYKLWDVQEGTISMKKFIAQLTDEDLMTIVRGEGMNSPKVTPGTGAAFGGVTKRLVSFGIPTTCCSDGPSGIRMDCGTQAFAMPNGTALACTFNNQLVKELYRFEGLELRKDHIDALLGPGMNLHRHPLNGRNFEYFSEDPLLTGKMAAAQLHGMHKYGVTGVIKHFAMNNQEYRRNYVNGIVSERAARELYLKGFEIAVKEGGADAVMTTYGPVNGQYTAGNYDLLTTILRKEWGFSGIAMTDWWAQINDVEKESEKMPSRQNTAAMVRAQNDLYMVVSDSGSNSSGDNLEAALADGRLTRGELQRSAMNICWFVMGTPAYLRLHGKESDLDRKLAEEERSADTSFLNVIPVHMEMGGILPAEKINTGRGKSTIFQIVGKYTGIAKLTFEARITGSSSLAQIPLFIFQDRSLLQTLTLTGEDREWKAYEIELNPFLHANFFLKFYFGMSGMELRRMKLLMDREKSDMLLKKMKEFREGNQ